MNRRSLIASLLAVLGLVLFLVLHPLIAMPPWLNWAGPFTFAALVSCALVPVLSVPARRIDLVDRPDERKHHIGAIPLVGGLAIYLGFLAVTFLYLNLPHHYEGRVIGAIMLALGLLVLIGLLDDLLELSALLKLLVQLGAAAIVIAAGVRITFLPETWWGDALEIAVTSLWLLGLTNAVNFLDGVDGLATALTITAAAAFGLVAVQTQQPDFLLLCAGLGGACAGFLPYNFRPRPASAFLGDAGATLLGFALASIAIVGEWGNGPGAITLDVVVPLLILGVPVFDTTFITITRIADGRIRTFREWLEYTGRDHIHHRLLKLGLNRFDTVFFLCIISVVLSLSAITLHNATGLLAILSLVQGAVILVIIGRFMLFMERRNACPEEMIDGSAE